MLSTLMSALRELTKKSATKATSRFTRYSRSWPSAGGIRVSLYRQDRPRRTWLTGFHKTRCMKSSLLLYRKQAHCRQPNTAASRHISFASGQFSRSWRFPWAIKKARGAKRLEPVNLIKSVTNPAEPLNKHQVSVPLA